MRCPECESPTVVKWTNDQYCGQVEACESCQWWHPWEPGVHADQAAELARLRALDAARDNGAGARIDGEPETASPHRVDTAEHAAWMDGWHAQDAVERLEVAERERDALIPEAERAWRAEGQAAALRDALEGVAAWCAGADSTAGSLALYRPDPISLGMADGILRDTESAAREWRGRVMGDALDEIERLREALTDATARADDFLLEMGRKHAKLREQARAFKAAEARAEAAEGAVAVLQGNARRMLALDGDETEAEQSEAIESLADAVRDTEAAAREWRGRVRAEALEGCAGAMSATPSIPSRVVRFVLDRAAAERGEG